MKTKNDARGAREMCINFDQCPMCYGCRNYNTRDIECEECENSRKINICKTDLHRPDLIHKMITRTKVNHKLP